MDPQVRSAIFNMVEIDPHGDLKVIVSEEKTCFLVCSRTLCRSAQPWAAMLYGPFVDSKSTGGQEWKVELPEDHSGAFELLMNIVHWPGQPGKLPTIDLPPALEGTILTNEYMMTQC